jgi:hypothetical protein
VKTRTSGGIRSDGDLPDVLLLWSASPGVSRVHCHVPLYAEPIPPLSTTASLLTQAFFRTAAKAGARIFEIETYTYGALPERLRTRSPVESIVEEFRWVRARAAISRP